MPKYVVRYSIEDIYEATIEADDMDQVRDIVHEASGSNLEDCSWIDGGIEFQDFWIVKTEPIVYEELEEGLATKYGA
jgi:hypothetical protein